MHLEAAMSGQRKSEASRVNRREREIADQCDFDHLERIAAELAEERRLSRFLVRRPPMFEVPYSDRVH